MSKVRAYRTLENALRRMGFVYVAGVDEVGRGCLAGPVVAAAVESHSRELAARSSAGDASTAPLMAALRARDPRSGSDRHKGYATHHPRGALPPYGYPNVHPRSFRPPSLFDTID